MTNIHRIGYTTDHLEIAKASVNTYRLQSNMEWLKIRLLGKAIFLTDMHGDLHKCVTYEGKDYYVSRHTLDGDSRFDKAFGYARDLFAALGLVAAAGIVGLSYMGFFTWLASKYPESAILQLVGSL